MHDRQFTEYDWAIMGLGEYDDDSTLDPPRYIIPSDPSVRTFETGATRDSEEGKLDFEGFFSPLVLRERARYMQRHRVQSDGSLRASDNWQRGIPLDAYMKSGFRHFMDWWLEHRGHKSREGLVNAICGLLFNGMGYLSLILKEYENEKNK